MTLNPQRVVQNNLLYSRNSPAISIEVKSPFTYAGSQSIILYNVAQAEQHLFVIVDSNQHVMRLVWVQFEYYLDNNQYTYNYPMSTKMELGGYEFLQNTDVMNIDEASQKRSDSDFAQVVICLREHGCIWSGDTIFKRMIWLDNDKRKELMIIYSEELKTAGIEMEQAVKLDRSSNRWVELEQDLHKRALASFSLAAA